MSLKDEPEEALAAPPSLPSALSTSTPEEPYSIFDKRQKALIVGIVSIAATCKSIFTVIGTILLDDVKRSLWFRVQYLFPCTSYHCGGP